MRLMNGWFLSGTSQLGGINASSCFVRRLCAVWRRKAPRKSVCQYSDKPGELILEKEKLI